MKSTLRARGRSAAAAVIACSLAAALGAGCGGSSGNEGGAGSGGAPSGGAGGSGGETTGFGASSPSGGAGGIEECVAATQVAELTPLDVYLMLDQSGSMIGAWDQGQYDSCTQAFDSGGITPLDRWGDVTKAIGAFASDPGSAGIAVGLGFFPPKQSDQSGAKCEDNKCDVQAYSAPSVPIAALPDNAAAIEQALDFAPCPCNGTPMSAALQGAVAHAKEQAAKAPDHEVVVILATDGVPNGACSGASNDSQGYKAPEDVAHDAFTGDPSIPVYVIGVGTELTSLNALAEQGGTQSAFLVDANQGTEQALIAALNEIRGQALSCEITIPPAPAGQTLEPGKVNVTYSPGDGSPEVTLTAVKDEAGCAASPQSWYHDDPASPEKVILCAAACAEIQGHPAATLHVAFGCETILAVPE